MPPERYNGSETGMCLHGNAWGKKGDPCTQESGENGQELIQAKEQEWSTLMLSKETMEVIHSYPDLFRDEFVGAAMQYISVDPDQKRLSAYLESFRSHLGGSLGQVIDFRTSRVRAKGFIRAACANLGRKLPLDAQGKEDVFQWMTKKYISEGYFYHGFNGVFESSIRQTNLDAETRLWDWSDVDAVRDIFERVGQPLQLVHTKINSKAKLSIGDHPQNVYHYAVSSPEWFGNFLITGSMNLNLDQTAFFRRDYHAARENLERICQSLTGRDEKAIREKKAYPNLTADEEKTIFAFFDRYWNLFASEAARPKVALIKRSTLEGRTWVVADTYAKWKEIMSSGRYSLDDLSLEHAIELLMAPVEINTQIAQAIPGKDFMVVDLPTYNEVHPVIEDSV